jgi:hypothetical protein
MAPFGSARGPQASRFATAPSGETVQGLLAQAGCVRMCRPTATGSHDMKDDLDDDAQYHMRLLVDRVPSMLAYWDRDLLCRFANRAYEA